MTRAAIYARVSTQRQAESDLSMPDQVAQCRLYCERQGWEVVEVFSEPGASALDDDRPVFQELIFKATRSDRPFDFVVVHSLSRFSRDSFHSELYVRKLRKARVELVSITQAMEASPAGELVRKVLNAFDEHQSRENAKHVHRSMLENARQGFWNGAVPPFGYKTAIKERRGSKDKKVLVVDEEEARVVRRIFEMASGADGRPVGVKAIALWLNERGFLRRGHRFATGSVHEILTTTAYHGVHYFNRRDSRSGLAHLPSQWVAMQVPKIIDEETFNAVRGLLQSRAPKRMPPRVANGPTFLAGLARCGYCDSAMIQNTGKGGRYRYYCCSRKLKEGPMSCRGLRMPMEKLDDIVICEVAKRVLEPKRLGQMLETYVKAAAARGDQNKEKLSKLRHDHKEAEAGLARLMGLVEKGLMDLGDPALGERLVALKLQRDEIAREIRDFQKRMSSDAPVITPEKIGRVASLLRDKLHGGPPELKQAYARLLMDEVRVTEEEIRISGSKDVLARAASEGMDMPTPAVLSFVQEWRTRHDSNV